MKKYYTIITACAIFFSLSSNAQQVTGIIKSQDNKVIEAATVSLLATRDSSIVKIALTDKSGVFEFEKIKGDNYLLRVDALGYKKFFSNTIAIALGKTTNAGNIV